MTTTNFCYWLQGFFEIGGVRAITEEEAKLVQAHLNMVFIHDIDPKAGNQEHQEKLNDAHHGIKPTLQELIPEHTVHVNAGPGFYTDARLKKPEGWTEKWEYSTLHGWYNPEQGTPRC